MRAFDGDSDRHRLDYQLMIRSPVHLVHRRELLHEMVTWLGQHGYHLIDVDASWLITEHMFRDLASAFHACCHDNFGCLQEGLGDALRDVQSFPDHVLVVLRGFDAFVRSRRDDAESLIGMFAATAWPAAMTGRRLLVLLQSDDPKLVMGPIPMWTPCVQDAMYAAALQST